MAKLLGELVSDYREGGVWSSEISGIIDLEGRPIQMYCSAIEYDDTVARPPFGELEHRHRTMERAQQESLQDFTRSAFNITALALHNVDTSDQKSMIEYINAIRRETSKVQDQANRSNAAARRQQVDPKDAISAWLSQLSVPHKYSDVFYSEHLGEESTSIDAVLRRYAQIITTEVHGDAKIGRGYLHEQLKQLPAPVFGSRPTGLESLSKAVGTGSFLGTVTVAYETHGPALAIFTATAGFVVWFGRPAVTVARQATKNWVAEKLDVKKLDKD